MRTIAPLLLLLPLAACGGGGDGGDPASASDIGTLAYVETECRGTREGFFERQALRIRQGEHEPVTVFETPEVSLPGQGFLCAYSVAGRIGNGSIVREAFQSVAVSPDGASVVFEVTDEFSVRPPLPLNLPPEQKGIFWVRADGTGLRRLAPPSRTPFFDITPSGGLAEAGGFGLNFSPDGRTIAFADKVLGVDGDETDQVVTVDVATGTRTQVTHLPPAVPPAGYSANAPTIFTPRFVDERTISFRSSANPDGLNPEGAYLLMTARTDGSGFDVPLPVPVALPGGTIELRFVITGNRPQAQPLIVPGKPTNPLGVFPPDIWEIFLIDEGKNILQLTNFHRSDTWFGLVDVDREHVYFNASADPLGTNPSENCQMFSIDRLGSDLRQLTNFHEIEHSASGCGFSLLGLGCAVAPLWQDPRTRDLLLYSNCDPLGTNPDGGQIFAMQPDGSGLRQLTDSRGWVFESDRTIIGELPGPWAYGPYEP